MADLIVSIVIDEPSWKRLRRTLSPAACLLWCDLFPESQRTGKYSAIMPAVDPDILRELMTAQEVWLDPDDPSRYFHAGVIRAKERSSARNSEAGKVSAAKRKERDGTAQPRRSAPSSVERPERGQRRSSRSTEPPPVPNVPNVPNGVDLPEQTETETKTTSSRTSSSSTPSTTTADDDGSEREAPAVIGAKALLDERWLSPARRAKAEEERRVASMTGEERSADLARLRAMASTHPEPSR
ncbi:MAG: hypothetical protein ACOYBP_09275 [Microbacteriaceae bacterium]